MVKQFENELVYLTGNNFSGRSHFLKSLDVINSCKSLYIGEQPSNYISGIFPTVKDEINLHLNVSSEQTIKVINSLFSKYRFDKHYHKNPFTLSGGEQTILVVLSSLLLQPQMLAIDTTLEQLDREWLLILLEAIEKQSFSNSKIYIADNRVEEYSSNLIYKIEVPAMISARHEFDIKSPEFNTLFSSDSQPNNIELKNVSFSYDKRDEVLKQVNVVLSSGNVYHLNGKNGSGKSTLAKLLTGILKAKEGKLLINGQAYNSYRYPGRLTAYCFQSPDDQIFSSTVEKEVLVSIKNESAAYKQRRDICLKMFGLQNVRKCHPAELPFVVRKRISLAATFALDRSWYILDEPTLGQDVYFVEFLVQFLKYLTELGKGIIVISHSKGLIEKLHAKALNLENGHLSH